MKKDLSNFVNQAAKGMGNMFVKAKQGIKGLMFPFIVLYFIRTLLLPSVIDIIILFILFLIYIGAHLDWY